MISGAELRRRRKALGMTQAELSRKAGVSQSLIARIESGGVDPRLSTFLKIMKVLEDANRSQPRARDIMTTRLIYARPEDDVARAIKLMQEHNISQMPVMKGEKPIGSVSEVDLLRKAMNVGIDRMERMKIKDVMGPQFPVVDENTPLSSLPALLENNQALLVASGGKIVGIITKIDLFKQLSAQEKL